MFPTPTNVDDRLTEAAAAVEAGDLAQRVLAARVYRLPYARLKARVAVQAPRRFNILEEFVLRAAAELTPAPTPAELAGLLGLDVLFVESTLKQLEGLQAVARRTSAAPAPVALTAQGKQFLAQGQALQPPEHKSLSFIYRAGLEDLRLWLAPAPADGNVPVLPGLSAEAREQLVAQAQTAVKLPRVIAAAEAAGLRLHVPAEGRLLTAVDQVALEDTSFAAVGVIVVQDAASERLSVRGFAVDSPAADPALQTLLDKWLKAGRIKVADFLPPAPEPEAPAPAARPVPPPAPKPAPPVTTPPPTVATPVTPAPPKPAAEPIKPAVAPARPAAETIKPAAETPKPTVPPARPAPAPIKPTAETPKPAAETVKPAPPVAKPAPAPARPVAHSAGDSSDAGDANPKRRASSDTGDSGDANPQRRAASDAGDSGDANLKRRASSDAGDSGDANLKRRASSDAGDSGDANPQRRASSDAGDSSDANPKRRASSDTGDSGDANPQRRAASDAGDSSDAGEADDPAVELPAAPPDAGHEYAERYRQYLSLPAAERPAVPDVELLRAGSAANRARQLLTATGHTALLLLPHLNPQTAGEALRSDLQTLAARAVQTVIGWGTADEREDEPAAPAPGVVEALQRLLTPDGLPAAAVWWVGSLYGQDVVLDYETLVSSVPGAQGAASTYVITAPDLVTTALEDLEPSFARAARMAWHAAAGAPQQTRVALQRCVLTWVAVRRPSEALSHVLKLAAQAAEEEPETMLVAWEMLTATLLPLARRAAKPAVLKALGLADALHRAVPEFLDWSDSILAPGSSGMTPFVTALHPLLGQAELDDAGLPALLSGLLERWQAARPAGTTAPFAEAFSFPKDPDAARDRLAKKRRY